MELIQIEMMAKQRFMDKLDPVQGMEWKEYNNQLADEQFAEVMNSRVVFNADNFIVKF